MSHDPSRPESAQLPLGRLILVPCGLDFGMPDPVPLSEVLPAATLLQAAALDHWISENAKSTRAFLNRVSHHTALRVPLQQQHIQELPRELHKKGDHQGQHDVQYLLKPALMGHDIGLVSEAGMPAIADPGSSVVQAAHRLGLTVHALVGPVSLMLALASSGLNGQNFAFVGYLPQTAPERIQRIRELESLALSSGQTQLFIETPYRNQAMLDALLSCLRPTTRLAVSAGLTLAQCHSFAATVSDWRTRPNSLSNKVPAVFALG